MRPHKPKGKEYVLRLYIAGTTSKSVRAVANIKEICRKNLENRFDLEVIDIYQQPALAKGMQVIAAPTLVKQLPLPLRKFIGDMSNTDRILVGLEIKPTK
jgi:circadian clock protein KaiB